VLVKINGQSMLYSTPRVSLYSKEVTFHNYVCMGVHDMCSTSQEERASMKQKTVHLTC
jgi:hypothetical protein